MSLNIPEGFVAVKRGPGVAAALLEAADKVGGDRKLGVRTTSQGVYFVAEEIAEQWQKDQPDAEVVDEDGESGLSAEEIEARGYPEGDISESWTVKNLEAWAAAQEPAVELGDGNKADKLKAALDAVAAKSE